MYSELLSVIVPVYNNEKYLEECVNSILNQTYTNLEIILVNDGSKDNSGKLCDELAKKDARIRVIHKENGGAISARRTGCLEAKARYVTFVDSDDWIEPDMYQYLMEELVAHKADIVTSGFIFGFGQVYDGLKAGVYEGELLEQYIFRKMIQDKDSFSGGMISSVCNKIFRKDLIQESLCAMKKAIRQWEDVAYLYLACYRANCIRITDKAFYHYRENMDSVTRAYDPNYFVKSCDSFAYIEEYFIKNGAEELVSQLIYMKLWSLVHALEIELERPFLKLSKYTWRNIINSADAKEIMEKIDLEHVNLQEHMKREVKLLMDGHYIKARFVHDIYRLKKVYWKIRDRRR